jgi:tripartite-type tricarboxylate transporter receptor subunit TctC
MKHLAPICGLSLSLLALTTTAGAQNYPAKTIKIVVPYPADVGAKVQ